MILVGILIPILLFFVSMNITYAYFTAKVQTENASASTAVLKIQFSEETDIYANSQKVTTNTKLLPGDALSVSGAVENVGNAQIYVIIAFKLYVTKSGESTKETLQDEYYSIQDSQTTRITKVDETYLVTAFTLDINASKTFEISYLFDVNKFDNTYKNATVSYELQAYALQKETIDDTNEATDLIFQQFVNVE